MEKRFRPLCTQTEQRLPLRITVVNPSTYRGQRLPVSACFGKPAIKHTESFLPNVRTSHLCGHFALPRRGRLCAADTGQYGCAVREADTLDHRRRCLDRCFTGDPGRVCVHIRLDPSGLETG